MSLECLICGGKDFALVYKGPIRSGRFGTLTNTAKKVVRCEQCGTTRLNSFQADKSYYESNDYRLEYNGSADIKDYIEAHDHEQADRIKRIGLEKFRNKVVVDFGCGGGSFLDAVKGFAHKTIGIDPFSAYHVSLKERGHVVFGDSQSAISDSANSVDIVVSYGVIEHTENPLQYLKDALALLKPGGSIFLETDNLNDIIRHLDFPEFNEFFFRTAHLYYFEEETIGDLFDRAGFSDIKVGFRHNYDLSNLLVWLKDKRPSGNGKVQLFDATFDAYWRRMVEQSGKADLLAIEARKL